MSAAPVPVPASNRGLVVGFALGAPVMAYGVGGMLVDAGRTHPTELARWVVGAALVHDLVVVPVALAGATLLRRVVGPRVWPTVRWAIVTTAVLTAFALPFVRGYGQDPRIPSLLNRNYAVGLATFVAVVWAAASLVLVYGAVRRRAGR